LGCIAAICISREKGTVKEPVPRAELRMDHGIVDDAHAGPWHRQVSLLPRESIERMKEIIPTIVDGAFAENVVTDGIDLATLSIGDHLRLGDEVVLEVTQIGKECHNACAIKVQVGDCIMPREGIFCRVLAGGTLTPGDAVTAEHREEERG